MDRKINWSLGINVTFNILFILEVLFSQFILVNGLTTTQAMQSEIHRHLAKLLTFSDISKIFNVLAVMNTTQYSNAYLDSDIIE